jgi:hypothetical protein
MVHVCLQVTYLASPGSQVMMANAHEGLPVVRGKDWKWPGQDNNSYGCVWDGIPVADCGLLPGVITYSVLTKPLFSHVVVSGLARNDGWVEVKWTVSQETICYRIGVENAFDLKVGLL